MTRASLPIATRLLAVLVLAAGLSACSGARSACGGCEVASPCAATAPCDCPCPAPAQPECSPCGPRPAHAKAGEAWCCVWIPPVDGTVDEQVCVKPASTRSVYVPPSYGTRIKLICDAPPMVEERAKPGVYAVQRRDVLVKPGSECIVPVCCPPGDLQPGEVQGCCVAKKTTPPVFTEECSRVCLEPDRLCLVYTPAKYRCVDERYMISPGFTQQVCEPAEYKTVCKKVCLQPGRWEWRLNEKCAVPPPPLQALQLEMTDSNPDGSAGGIFKVGTEIRYDVVVTSDTASGAMQGLTVHFQLPPELTFVSGTGDGGLTVTGSGQSAQTSAFSLAGEKSQKLHVRVRVKSAPAKELLQVQAVVKSQSGAELATETESSTVPNLP
jgi:hypothetical protein